VVAALTTQPEPVDDVLAGDGPLSVPGSLAVVHTPAHVHIRSTGQPACSSSAMLPQLALGAPTSDAADVHRGRAQRGDQPGTKTRTRSLTATVTATASYSGELY